MKNQKRSVYLTVEQRLTIWIHIIMLSGRLWKFSAVVELVLIGLSRSASSFAMLVIKAVFEEPITPIRRMFFTEVISL